MSPQELTSFGEEFVRRVKELLPQNFNLNDLTVLSNGLVLAPNSKEGSQGFSPLGCPVCLGVPPKQDSEGYPTIGGTRLLTPEQAGHSTDNISPEFTANLWLCHNCFVPVSSLLPQFDLSAL